MSLAAQFSPAIAETRIPAFAPPLTLVQLAPETWDAAIAGFDDVCQVPGIATTYRLGHGAACAGPAPIATAAVAVSTTPTIAERILDRTSAPGTRIDMQR